MNAFMTRSLALFLALSHTKKPLALWWTKNSKETSCSVKACSDERTGKENRHLRQKNCLLNPISDTDQREIVDCKILKILVRCFLPTSRLMMTGTAEC